MEGVHPTQLLLLDVAVSVIFKFHHSYFVLVVVFDTCYNLDCILYVYVVMPLISTISTVHRRGRSGQLGNTQGSTSLPRHRSGWNSYCYFSWFM